MAEDPIHEVWVHEAETIDMVGIYRSATSVMSLAEGTTIVQPGLLPLVATELVIVVLIDSMVDGGTGHDLLTIAVPDIEALAQDVAASTIQTRCQL